MHRAPTAPRVLAASLAIWLGLCSVAAAQGAGGDLLVARPRADAELADVAAGHTAWLNDKLSRAGLSVVVEGRRQDSAASGSPEIAALRDLARASGATLLVLPELRLRDGSFEVRLALYAVESGALLAAPHASASLATPGAACEETAAHLLERLGVPASEIPAASPPQLDELAASGRALHQLEAGDFARAWREVEGKLSPTAMRLREEITAQAGRADTPLVERARVLAVSGDGLGAWKLIAPELGRGPDAPPPDPRLLLAAAQAQLARGDPRAARPWLDRLLATRPDDAELQLELGRLSMLTNDRDGARAALTRSAELDTASPLPFVLLGEVDAGDPQRQAQHLLAAGRREAARLNTQRAENYFERAIELAPEAEKPTLRAIGAMNQRIGRPAEALAAFAAAREAGDSDA